MNVAPKFVVNSTKQNDLHSSVEQKMSTRSNVSKHYCQSTNQQNYSSIHHELHRYGKTMKENFLSDIVLYEKKQEKDPLKNLLSAIDEYMGIPNKKEL